MDQQFVIMHTVASKTISTFFLVKNGKGYLVHRLAPHSPDFLILDCWIHRVLLHHSLPSHRLHSGYRCKYLKGLVWRQLLHVLKCVQGGKSEKFKHHTKSVLASTTSPFPFIKGTGAVVFMAVCCRSKCHSCLEHDQLASLCNFSWKLLSFPCRSSPISFSSAFNSQSSAPKTWWPASLFSKCVHCQL